MPHGLGRAGPESDERASRSAGGNVQDDVVTVGSVAMARSKSSRGWHANRGWPANERTIRSFGENRVCAARACVTRLSRYNPDDYCAAHHDQVPWQPSTRRRRD
jgi:hypothetical protein